MGTDEGDTTYLGVNNEKERQKTLKSLEARMTMSASSARKSLRLVCPMFICIRYSLYMGVKNG